MTFTFYLQLRQKKFTQQIFCNQWKRYKAKDWRR